jgi:Tol biopolymer transport system component
MGQRRTLDPRLRTLFFSEVALLIAGLPENVAIVPDSVRPMVEKGKVAYVYEGDNKFKVCMNGDCGPDVDRVARGMPIVSLDGNHVAAVVQKSGNTHVMLNGQLSRGYDMVYALAFSPDSMSVAYIASENDRFSVHINQDRHQEFSAIDPKQGLIFSSDSKHLVYVAVTDDKKWRVVRNGEPGPAYDEIQHVAFSPDARRLVYAARQAGQWRLVEEDRSGPAYDTIPRVAFSPDSKSLAYVARSKADAFVVLNGVKSQRFDGVSGVPVFSSDSNRLAYSVIEKVGKDIRMRLVVDGQPGAPYDFIGAYLFSRDGRHFAYAARRGEKEMIVHGKIEHNAYDQVGIPIFSPRGRNLAYVIQDAGKWHVVENREKGLPYDMISHPVFSSQGERMAYLASLVPFYAVVADGKIQGSHLWAGEVVFSPDEKHLAYAAAGEGGSGLVIDGREGRERFLSFLKGADLVFIDDRTVQGIALREGGREFWLIRATIDTKN